MVSQRPLRVSVLGFGGTWLRWNSRDPLWGLCWASVDLVSVEPGFGGTPETPYGVSVVWLRWIWLGWSGFGGTPETPYGVSVLGLRWIWLGWSGFGGTPETLKGLCLGLRSLDLASVELQRPHRGSLWFGFGLWTWLRWNSRDPIGGLCVSVTWLRWNSRDPIGGLCGLALAGSWSGFGWL